MKNQAVLKQEYRVKKPQRQISFKTMFIHLIWMMAIVGSLSTTGCGPMLVRSMVVDKAGIPQTPPAPGSGRLFVYVVDGGPNLWNAMGANCWCSVDEMVCNILGSSFSYIDLPTGMHKVTADGVASDTWLYKPRYGKNVVQFDLKEGESKYCRIDLSGRVDVSVLGGSTSFTPVMVETDVAEVELVKLDHFKDFKTKRTIK